MVIVHDDDIAPDMPACWVAHRAHRDPLGIGGWSHEVIPATVLEVMRPSVRGQVGYLIIRSREERNGSVRTFHRHWLGDPPGLTADQTKWERGLFYCGAFLLHLGSRHPTRDEINALLAFDRASIVPPLP